MKDNELLLSCPFGVQFKPWLVVQPYPTHGIHSVYYDRETGGMGRNGTALMEKKLKASKSRYTKRGSVI